MKIGICYKDGSEEKAAKIADHLKEKFDINLLFPIEKALNFSEKADILIVVGGDGTVIKCAKIVRDKVPLLGVKAGRLGFLSSYTFGDVDRMIEDIENNRLIKEKRFFLEVNTANDSFFALNDVVLEKDIDGRMLEIEVVVSDGNPLWFFADGIIVSTPTGSTAYNLSAGGPVVHPSSETLQITPLLPHFLFNRGIVVPSSSIIRIMVDIESNLLLDGKLMGKFQKIDVRKSEMNVTILRPKDHDFYMALKNRLGYGKRMI